MKARKPYQERLFDPAQYDRGWGPRPTNQEQMPGPYPGPDRELPVKGSTTKRGFLLSNSQFTTPGGDELVMESYVTPATGDYDTSEYGVTAFRRGDATRAPVGALTWSGNSEYTVGEIHRVSVAPRMRRQGIATAMHDMASRAPEPPRHSDVLSDAGAAWARSVGGPSRGVEENIEYDRVDDAPGFEHPYLDDDADTIGQVPQQPPSRWWRGKGRPVATDPTIYEQQKLATGNDRFIRNPTDRSLDGVTYGVKDHPLSEWDEDELQSRGPYGY